jgi:ribonuclease R
MNLNKVLGVFKLSSNTSNVINGVTYKKFYPFHKDIEPFLVKTKRIQLKDVIALVSVQDKSVIEYYDDLNNSSTNKKDLSRLLSKANWTTYKKDIKDFIDNIIKNNIDLSPNRIDLTHITSYTIDPENSKDRDDALSINIFNNHYIIYIHIADPTSYFDENNILDRELRERCSSIYLKDKVHHMMPEEFAENIIALNNNNSRAFTCEIIFDENYKRLAYKFYKSFINPINLTYEEADKIKDKNKDIKNLYEFGKHLNLGFNKYYDIHEMVAQYMILCNYLVGLTLKDDISISRYNNSTITNNINENKLTKITSKNEVYELLTNKLKYKRAEYSVSNNGHNILGLEYYQHFTSPIRRYADLVVHRILSNKLGLINYNIDKNKLIKLCSKLNTVNKLYKLSYQIDNIYDKIKDFNQILNGKIVNIDDNYINIYVENLDLIMSFNLINHKIKELYDIMIKDNIIVITDKYNNKFELTLYQEVDFKIYENILSRNIFSIELLNPKIKDFFII